MFSKNLVSLGAVFTLTVAAQQAHAHAPIFNCASAGSKIRCEAGYSDGSSAAGRTIAVLDVNHKLLSEGKVGADGKFEFDRPTGDFHVAFDGGQYHQITLYSRDIE